MNPGLQSNDELSYNEVSHSPSSFHRMEPVVHLEIEYFQHRQQTTLNTPVVALQTPNISYPNLGSFGPQDFSMNSADVMGMSNWNHGNLTAVQHSRYASGSLSLSLWNRVIICLLPDCSGLTQLAVSNSTPPPSTSPIPIKVKSEPVSPPRDHHMAHAQSTTGLSVTTMNNATSNISHLSHPQSHLIMNSRPSSTGHMTPTPGTTRLKTISIDRIKWTQLFRKSFHSSSLLLSVSV